MEVSGAVLRPLPCLSGAGFDTHSLQPSLSCQSIDAGKRFSGELRLLGSRDSKVFVKPRKYSGVSNSFFSNDGHLQYYVSPRSGGKKEKEKEKEKEKGKSSEMKAIKKKLKLVRGLSKDLSMFSGMGFGLNSEDGLIEEVKEKLVSEAAEVLLAQLQHLRAEEKEMKRKRKEEKAKLKADRMKAMGDCKGSSSSSSESSDSECGEVIDMSQLRKESVAETKVDPQQETDAMLTSPSLLIHEKSIVGVEEIEDRSIVNCRQECCHGGESSCSSASTINNNDQSNVVVGTSAQRIEICMGGKCKKSGAAALLEEFERRIGVEGAVVGCKCMGKCRDGPNVRVLNRCDATEGVDTSVRTPANPLCIGVGLEDVSSILTNFFGEESRDFGLMATS